MRKVKDFKKLKKGTRLVVFGKKAIWITKFIKIGDSTKYSFSNKEDIVCRAWRDLETKESYKGYCCFRKTDNIYEITDKEAKQKDKLRMLRNLK